MADHPGLVFREGPTGRRPRLAGGPDVWEVIETFLDEARDVEAAARYLETTIPADRGQWWSHGGRGSAPGSARCR